MTGPALIVERTPPVNVKGAPRRLPAEYPGFGPTWPRSWFLGRYPGPPWLPMPVRIKALLAVRDGGWRCSYCGVGLAVAILHYLDHYVRAELPPPTTDHVVARSRGGSDELDNLVLSCLPCNASKGAS